MATDISFSQDFTDFNFYGGFGSTSLVPRRFNVSLNGRSYLVDFAQPFYRQYRRQLTQLLRTQADTSPLPSEQSINPDDLWRRSQESWHLGAGQRYLDRKDTSLPYGFWQSKGINVWTKWQVSLLPDTRQIRNSGNTNLRIVTAGTYTYITDGNSLLYTQDITVSSPSWTAVTGTPANTISSIATDGYNIWIACGSNGVYTTTRGAASATQLVTSSLSSTAIVGFLKGRLMVANNNSIYNVTSSSPAALPTALFTHNNTDFRWVGFAEGLTQIYMAGYSGNRSWIYGCTILADGTALQAPIVQGELPDNETVTSIQGYLSYLIVGSALGVRFATTDASGAITLQALIPTSSSVQCLDPDGRFVYFGWTNYDSASTGLGCMDLQNFAVGGIQPAYASDLMVTANGAVTSTKKIQSLRMLAVAASGFWVQSSLPVASGTLDSGYILYDLPDKKVAQLLDVQSVAPLPAGSYKAYLSVDGGDFNVIGQHFPTDPEPVVFTAGQKTGVKFEVRLELDRDAAATPSTLSPIVNRITLKSYPAPKRPLTWQIPLILRETVQNASGSQDSLDPLVELQALEAMAIAGRMVSFQEGLLSYSVAVSDIEFLPEKPTRDQHFFNGICIVQLKGIPGN